MLGWGDARISSETAPSAANRATPSKEPLAILSARRNLRADVSYNPLDLGNLADQLRRALEEQPDSPLEGLTKFPGAGVYALYYSGPYPLYRRLADVNGPSARVPIYVGKAMVDSARKGGGATIEVTSPFLHKRIMKHADSIAAATKSLNPRHFRVRALVTQPVWVPLGEAALIARYRPLWNVVIDGFGNNDPGGRRRLQYRSVWDHLHPGRGWAAQQAENPGFNIKEVSAKVSAHLQQHLPS